MFTAFLVTMSLFVLTILSALIFFKGAALVKYVLCDTFGWHSDRVMAVSFAKGWALTPMKRHVIRSRLIVCKRCHREVRVAYSASVAHDWQHPERLFR